MADDSQHEEQSNQANDVNEKEEMLSAIKKLQADVGTLRSENDTLRKELSTVKSNNKSANRRVVRSVIRRLDYNEDTDNEERDTEREDEEQRNNEDENINNRDTNTGRQTNGEREEDRERTNRKSRHKSSRSHSKVPQSVEKELQEMKEMIQRIPGIPKPLEKATPTSYADSPFSDDIALVEIPKRFTVPNMKLYDGSTDPQEHIAQYKQRMFTVPLPKDLREPCMCKGFGSTLSGPAL